jgi:hypothetical protein
MVSRQIALLVVGMSLIAVGCAASSDTGADPAPTTALPPTVAPTTAAEPTTTVASTTTAAPTTTTTEAVTTTTKSPYETFFWGDMAEGETYRTNLFVIPFTIVGQPDWKVAGELTEIVGLGKDIHPDDAQHMSRGFVVLGGKAAETPDAVVEGMLASNRLESVKVVGETEIDGFPAIELTSMMPGDGDFKFVISVSGDTLFGTYRGVQQRWYVTDVNGQTAIIWIEAPVAQFDDWVVEAEAALETLHFITE